MFLGISFLTWWCNDFWCRNLRELDLRESEVEDLSGHWLSHFPDSCTSLVSLNIACLGSEVSFSALERLVSRCSNLETLRLNRAVPLDKLSNLIRRAPQLVELGTGAYTAELRSDVFSNLAATFSGCKKLKSLSGFWDVIPAYLPAIYSVCSGLTSLNLSYATIHNPDISILVSQCHNLQQLWVCLILFIVVYLMTWFFAVFFTYYFGACCFWEILLPSAQQIWAYRRYSTN